MSTEIVIGASSYVDESTRTFFSAIITGLVYAPLVNICFLGVGAGIDTGGPEEFEKLDFKADEDPVVYML